MRPDLAFVLIPVSNVQTPLPLGYLKRRCKDSLGWGGGGAMETADADLW